MYVCILEVRLQVRALILLFDTHQPMSLANTISMYYVSHKQSHSLIKLKIQMKNIFSALWP